MKIMIISDIHGGYDELEKVIEIFYKEKYDKLFMLGDIYSANADSKNDQVKELLDSIKNMECVRGNCDVFVSGLRYKRDFYVTEVNGMEVLLVHNKDTASNYIASKDPDIVFSGHTHIASISYKDGRYYVNPGSISKSREGENSFGTLEGNSICIKSIENKVLRKEQIKKA